MPTGELLLLLLHVICAAGGLVVPVLPCTGLDLEVLMLRDFTDVPAEQKKSPPYPQLPQVILLPALSL